MYICVCVYVHVYDRWLCKSVHVLMLIVKIIRRCKYEGVDKGGWAK